MRGFSLALVTLCSSGLAAQSVRVRVTSATTGPVAGAIVKLLDSTGAVTRSTLTNESGRALLPAPAAAKLRVKADRIGFHGITTAPFVVADTGSTPVDIVMPDDPVVLSEVRVNGNTRCVNDPAIAPATAALWGEIRKALDATAISRRAGLTFTMAVWKRALDSTMAIRFEKADTVETSTPRPFVAIDAARLSRDGYLVPDGRGGWNIYGPDEEVLLSEAFVATHCFRAVSKVQKNRALVGLRFEPAPGRRVAEVTGTLWAAADTKQLEYTEFGFVNTPDQLPAEGLSGRVEFSRLKEGWWIVERWHLRAPQMRLVRSTTIQDFQALGRWVMNGFTEDGGAVLAVTGPPRIRLGLIPRSGPNAGQD